MIKTEREELDQVTAVLRRAKAELLQGPPDPQRGAALGYVLEALTRLGRIREREDNDANASAWERRFGRG